MSIDEAIKNLERAKERGSTHVVLAYWEANTFDMEDNDEWAERADYIEDNMDWSNTHDSMFQLSQEYYDNYNLFE